MVERRKSDRRNKDVSATLNLLERSREQIGYARQFSEEAEKIFERAKVIAEKARRSQERADCANKTTELVYGSLEQIHNRAEQMHNRFVEQCDGQKKNQAGSGKGVTREKVSSMSNQAMGVAPQHKIVVIGASAGGVEAVTELIANLPADFPSPVLVALHTSAEGPGLLPAILNRRSALPAIPGENGAAIIPGRVYVAPVNRHMLVNNGHLRLLQGPAENRHRPAIDPLFRTAALSYGSYTIGVILTGYLDDGTAGLMAIKSQGGTAIVQDPGDATVPNMPQSALDNVDVDYTVPLRDIAPLLVRLVTNEAKSEPALKRADKLPGNGKLSVFTCPECQGTLFEEDENGLTRYRCRVGHIYSPDSMFADQSYALERALWAAVRSLEEHAELSRRLAERARRSDHERAVRRFQERWRASMADAEHIRRILTKSGRPGARDVDDAQKGEELRSA